MIDRETDFKINNNPPLKKGTKKNYNKQEPFLCVGCKKVWQPSTYYYYKHDQTRPEYLPYFPKYGCYELICKNCK